MSDTLTLARNSAVLEDQGSVLLPLRSGGLCEHDPLGFDAGDANLYRFVGNDPVDQVDSSGLKAVDTCVATGLGFQKAAADSPETLLFSVLLPIHSFIIIDGKGFGRFATTKEQGGKSPVDDARIRSNDLDVYPLKDPATVKPGEFYSVSNKVYLDDQVYDIVLFRVAVREFIDRETKTPGKYVVCVRDCYSFQEAAIEYGKQKSRRAPTILPQSVTKPSALLLSPPVAGAAKRTKSTVRSLIAPVFDVLDYLDDYFGRY